jgi:outer membrane protein assembly factor BamB
MGFAGAARGQATQWSDIANNGRNMVSPAKNLPDEISTATLLWNFPLEGKHVFSQVHLVGDYLFVGGDANILRDEALRNSNPRGGGILCLNRRTGDLVWELSLPGKSYDGSYGVGSAPVVEGDRVYIHANAFIMCVDLKGLSNGNDGPFTDEITFDNRFAPEGQELRELKPNHADIIWQIYAKESFRTSVHDASAGTPLLDGDVLWSTTSHQIGNHAAAAWKPTDAAFVVALDKRTGRVLARDQADVPIVFHGSWSSLSLGEVNKQKAIFWADGHGRLHAFKPVEAKNDGTTQTLQEYWVFDANPPDWRYEDGKPILYSKHNQLFGKYPTDVEWAPYPAGHKEQTLRGPCEFIATPVYYDGRIYIGLGRDHYYTNSPEAAARGIFYCLDPNGEGDITKTNVVWKTDKVGRTQSTASIADGLLYVADMVGNLNCLDIKTGELVWQHNVGRFVECRSQLLADGKIYVANEKREVFVFKAGREKVLLSQGLLPGFVVTPAADDGVIYFATNRNIAAYGSAKK